MAHTIGNVTRVDSHPYRANRDEYTTGLLIVGGSSSGTAAAVTAGRLGIETIWVLRAPRDMGGLSTNAINPDSDLPMRYLGGLALEYDTVARYTTGFNIGGKHNGEGYFAPFHVFFGYTRTIIDALPSVTVFADLVPVHVVKNQDTGHVDAVTFAHRNDPSRRVTIHADITIDAEIEGDVAELAGVTMTLRREGRSPSTDPTRDDESYAGRIFTREKPIGSLLVSGGALMKESTQGADESAATMGWNGSVTVKDYGEGTPESPWVLDRAPDGYDAEDFDWWNEGVYGVILDDEHRRWNIDHYLATIEGWRMPDGRHVLESMVVEDREANERAHLAHVIRGLWHLQHVRGEYRYGLSDLDFHEGLPSKYSLADFGTSTNSGDAPLPGLIYMREGRRMVNDHVFGGKLIEDDGSGLFIQKRYWHQRSAYFNAMLVDIHGVHRELNAGSGPEGMQLLRLAGFHDFGATCIPFDVFVPRSTEATGLLVSSAGAYTHQAYAAFPRMETGRILQGHACAAVAFHALHGGIPPHAVDVRLAQLTGLELHGQSLVYLEDSMPGTSWHVIDQMLAARRVPERNDQGVFQRESGMTAVEAREYLSRLFHEYAEEPLSKAKLNEVLGMIPDQVQDVTRGTMIRALSFAVGLPAAESVDAPFADVPADTELARLLTPWIQRGWIVAHPSHEFGHDAPMRFSEFKRHAFHLLFGAHCSTALPVGLAHEFAHDTFNRPDGVLGVLESGQHPENAKQWNIVSGQLRPISETDDSALTVITNDKDLDATVDVFLEQTQSNVAAGISIAEGVTGDGVRCYLRTDGPVVHAIGEVTRAGSVVQTHTLDIDTHQRGFSIRIVTKDGECSWYVDGKRFAIDDCEVSESANVGLWNAKGGRNRFDNFVVCRSTSVL